VLARLEARRRTADEDLEAVAVSDEAVAACVLAGIELPVLARAAAVMPLSDNTPGDAIRQMRLHAPLESDHAAHALVASRFGRGVSRVLLLLYGVELADVDDRLVQHEALVLRLELTDARHRLTTSFVREMQARDEVHAALCDAVELRRTAAQQRLASVARRLEDRLDALSRAVERRGSATPVQASLFDRREEQRAQARRAVVARWHEHLLTRRHRVRALAALTARRPRLMAAWLAE
jgi:hypothetical protein